jgi:IS5 family transposase
MTFDQFILKKQYEKIQGLGDRLERMKEVVDWMRFRPIVASVFRDTKEQGGRPHTDEILVVRALVLQACYGLSDQELEFYCYDRLSFRNFLDFPENIPDFTTVWKIRERLKEKGKEEKIWNELQSQLNNKGYKIEKGVIQDASFIEADLGKKRYYEEKKAKKQGKKIAYTGKQESHIDRDGTFSIKHGQVHYGYKNHIKLDIDYQLIRDYDVTTASLHDSQVNLVSCGDVAAYRDKGYVGTELHARGVEDHTMKRSTKRRKLNGGEQKRNFAISQVRAPGERPFSVLKRVFNGGRTFVKNISRVSIKEMFKLFAYNLYQLVTLTKA